MSRRHSRRRRHGRNDASQGALEAVFVGTFLFTAAIAVTSLEVVPPSIQADRFDLQALVRDALEGMESMSSGDSYRSSGDKIMIQALQGNRAPLESLVKRLMPSGTECRLWLDDGAEKHLLIGDPDAAPRGSVSASKLYRPSWAYAVMVPTLSIITPTQPLQIQGLGIAKASLAKQAGVPLSVEVNTTEGFYHKAATIALSKGPTVSVRILNSTGQPDYSAQDTLTSGHLFQRAWSGAPQADSFTMTGQEHSVTVRAEFTGINYNVVATFTDPLGVPWSFPAVGIADQSFEWILPVNAGTWTLGSNSALPPATSKVTITSLSVAEKTSWTIEFAEQSGNIVPAGTQFVIRMPGAFDNVGGESGANTIVTSQSDNTIFGRILSDFSMGVATVSVNGHPSDVRFKQSAFAIAIETLGETQTQSVFIVGDPSSKGSIDYPLPRGFSLNIPHPVAPGSTSDWGLVFNYAHPAVSAQVETIRQIDLKTPNGEPLFQTVAAVEPTNGWQRLGPDHLRWTGAIPVKANEAKGIRFQVKVVDTHSAADPPHRIPLSLDSGKVVNAIEHRLPNVFQLTVPPDGNEPGYKVPQGTAQSFAGLANLTWIKGTNKIVGNVSYNLTTFPPLQAMEESLRVTASLGYLNISKAKLGYGESAAVEADFRQLEDTLGLLGGAWKPPNTLVPYNWRVNLSIYDPTQPLSPDGMETWVPLVSAQTTLGNVSLTFSPQKGDFAGPHIVLGRAMFDLQDAKGDVLTETASLLGVIEVGRDWSESATSVYWATLECWLPDW